jgi:hypothetical protein
MKREANGDRPDNRVVAGRWIDAWAPTVDAAARAAAALLGTGGDGRPSSPEIQRQEGPLADRGIPAPGNRKWSPSTSDR